METSHTWQENLLVTAPTLWLEFLASNPGSSTYRLCGLDKLLHVPGLSFLLCETGGSRSTCLSAWQWELKQQSPHPGAWPTGSGEHHLNC